MLNKTKEILRSIYAVIRRPLNFGDFLWRPLNFVRDKIVEPYKHWRHRQKIIARCSIKGHIIIGLALKSLLAKRARSIFTLLGILIGFAAILFLVSFGWGLERIVVKEATGSKNLLFLDISTGGSSVIKISEENIFDWRMLPQIKELEGILTLPAKVKTKGKASDGILFATWPNFYQLNNLKPSSGSLPKESQALITTKLAQILDLPKDKILGQELKLDFIVGRNFLSEDQESPLKLEDQTFKLSGLLQDDESASVFIPYTSLLGNGVVGYSNTVAIANKRDDIPLVRKIIEGKGFATDYIGDTIAQITQVFGLFRLALGSFGLIALLVAALGMLNIMTISLLEKTREVGLMKAIGVKNRDIRRLFIYEALLLGAVGGLLGIIVGRLFSAVGNFWVSRAAEKAGGEAIVLFQSPWWFYLILVVFAFGVGFLTGLYPAWRAGKIDPLDALRYE